MNTTPFFRFLRRLKSIVRQPNLLIPGAPNYLIPDTLAYSKSLGLYHAGEDFIDGPEVVVWTLSPPAVLKLCAIKGEEYRQPEGHIRVSGPTSLVYINNGSILGPQGWVMNQSGGLFQDLVYSDRKGSNQSNSLFKRRKFPSKQKLHGCYATLCYPYSTNWYHWFIQSLPRLHLIEEYLDDIDGVFIPESQNHQRVLESLQLFGLDKSKVFVLGNRHYEVDSLFVPQYFAQSNVPAWVPQYMRSKIAKTANSIEPNCIYVSRADTVNRACHNEQEVIAALEALGFKSYQLSKMDFQAQAELFGSANLVIGAHGAGLSNIAFCQKGTPVIEIFPSAAVHSDLFHSLASAAGLNYYRFEAQADEGREDIHSSFTIQVSLLERLVRGLL